MRASVPVRPNGRLVVRCRAPGCARRRPALTQQLTADRLGDRPFVELADIGEDGLAGSRRSVEQREVSDAGQAHLERARDRRGGQRQHVDLGPELLDRLLVGDAEALLLVDHEQAEVLELDVGREQAVGSDDDVDLARGDPSATLRAWAAVRNARAPRPARETGEPLRKRLVVLLGQQRGGDQHGDLSAVLDRLERRPQRDLGLAEPDVAADQTVHRHRGFHVTLDRLDGAQLVGVSWKGTRELHVALPRRIGSEGVARRRPPSLVQHDELLGDLGDRRAHLGLGAAEIGAAHLVELGRLAARVEPDRVDLVRGHVELVAAAVLEQQVVPLHPAHGPGDHAVETADPVHLVHDMVAHLQVLEEPLGIAASGAWRAVGAAPAAQVGLGEQRQPGAGKDRAAVERGDQDAPTATAQLSSRRGCSLGQDGEREACWDSSASTRVAEAAESAQASTCSRR